MLRINVSFTRVVLEKLCNFLNTPKWGTWDFWPRKLSEKGFLKTRHFRGAWYLGWANLLRTGDCKLQGCKIGEHITAVAQRASFKCNNLRLLLCGAVANGIQSWWPGVIHHRGGDCSPVQDQPSRNAQQIQATDRAFAAILANGSVVTWGEPDTRWKLQGSSRSAQECATNSSHSVRHLLRSIGQWIRRYLGWARPAVVIAREFKISSRMCNKFKPQNLAFAAILANGSVVTWGHPRYGGDCSAVQDQLKNVQLVQATNLRHLLRSWPNGSAVSWGDPLSRWWLLCSSGSASVFVEDDFRSLSLK